MQKRSYNLIDDFKNIQKLRNPLRIDSCPIYVVLIDRNAITQSMVQGKSIIDVDGLRR